MWAKDKNAGFTLIELLIVIVIIGILATLIINTFKGIQDKARNARTIENVRQFYTALQAYHEDIGYYPLVSNPEDPTRVKMVCIGLGYPGGTCGKVTGTTVYESTDLYDQLKAESIGVGTDVINIVHGDVGSESFIGAAYGIDTISNPSYTGMGRAIEWFLEGKNKNCSVTGAYRYNTANGNTACEIFLEPLDS